MSINSTQSRALPVVNRSKSVNQLGMHNISPKIRLLILVVLALFFIGIFLFYGLQGNISYVLNRRALILATMVTVAFCSGISTILFQTITSNRILSPAIMGFESLFILIQTIMLFTWGFHGLSFLTSVSKFIVETTIMVTFSLTLYLWVFKMRHNNLFMVLLIGIVCGSFFGSLASLLQRMLNPDEFSIIQTHMFATFNIVPNKTLLSVSAIICSLIAIIIWRLNRSIDVLALGRNTAITLGLSYIKIISLLLILTSALVAISTALVGPLTFFGFLVASLTYQFINTYQHRYLLPASFLIGTIALVGGQFILQQLLGMSTTLSVVINFIGGLLFILILLKKASL